MSWRQSPPLPRRKYGATDDAAKFSSASNASEASLDKDQSLLCATRTKTAGKQRWGFVIMGALLVVGASVAGVSYQRAPTDADTSSDTNSAEVSPSVVSGATTSLNSPRFFPKASPPSTLELPALDFTALNPYHVRDGKPAQDYPWLKNVKLIEPYRDTTLAVSGPREGFEYRWKLNTAEGGEAGELRTEGGGSQVVAVLTTVGDHVVLLEEVDASGEIVRRLEEKVAVKYVRREIRTLMDDEREELLDAMYTLWAVPVDGGNGKELYGDGYADIFAINRLHYKAASPIECDHFHEGLGFLTNHGLITNTLEYSLQRVNPKLTLPYWDFTIEGSEIGDSDQADAVDLLLSTSPIFQESWFGTYDPEDNQVKDGRWAKTEIPSMKKDNPGNVTPDVYGKLRAPWNTNNREFLSRGMGKMCGENVGAFYPWPTCESHYNMVTSYEDFYSWVWASGFDPHGPVHIWIGGVMDCEETYGKIKELTGDAQAETLAMYSFVHRKNLYRDGLFKCEGAAEMEESPEELVSSGQCGCLDYDLAQGDDYEVMYDSMMGLSDVMVDFDVSTKRQVVKAFCDSTIGIGDNLQAGSSLDPTFWATHPTMERLWMYTVLTGQITDFDWPDSSSTSVDSKGKTISEELSLYGDTCVGHAGSDVFPYGILDADIDGFTIKTGIRGNPEYGNNLTNREVLAALDPRVDMLPYVYDTFEWVHCSADGFDFGDAMDSAKSKTFERAQRPVFEQGAPRAPRYSSIMALLTEGKLKRSEQI